MGKNIFHIKALYINNVNINRGNIMVYSAEISRRSPTCFIFLIDQSGSMEDPFGGDKTKKRQIVLQML